MNSTKATMNVIFLLFSFFVTSQAQSQPNIVFIFIDDLGWNDVGFHGSEIMVYFLQMILQQQKIASSGAQTDHWII